jgi:hypothetical protein
MGGFSGNPALGFTAMIYLFSGLALIVASLVSRNSRWRRLNAGVLVILTTVLLFWVWAYIGANAAPVIALFTIWVGPAAVALTADWVIARRFRKVGN